MERPSEGFLDEANDPAWAALSSNEQIESDPARYFKIAWAETYRDAEQQIAEESAFDRWHERKRQPQHVARQSFAGTVLGLVYGLPHAPKHRADSDI